MKIIAQSMIVPQPKYIHLGYVAASSYPSTQSPFALLACALFVGIGLILCCRVLLTKAFVETIEIKALQASAFKWVAAGLFLMTIGVSIPIIYREKPNRTAAKIFTHPKLYTNAIMHSIVVNYAYIYKPKQLTFTKSLEEKDLRKTDPWGKQIKIKVIKENPELLVRMNSAGPDKSFGSKDDIAYEFTAKPGKEYIDIKFKEL